MTSFALFPKIFSFKLSRALDNVLSLPINFTISLKYDCNARCKTCNVYTRKVDELTLEEWDNIFSGIGTSPYEFIFTGGESDWIFRNTEFPHRWIMRWFIPSKFGRN